MTEILGKSLHEIYKEDARRYKESIKLTGNFDKREALTVTMPMEEFDKLEKLALSANTDKLSIEKLEPIGYYNGAHGFLYDEFDKDCYCQGGCSMEAVYTESQVKKLTGENKVEKLQEQLNSKIKALRGIRANIEEHNQIYDLSVDTALLLEGIDGIAFDALEAEEENE